MRCSIVGSSDEEVASEGGANIKQAKSSHIVFADLTQKQVDILTEKGVHISLIGKTEVDVTHFVKVS